MDDIPLGPAPEHRDAIRLEATIARRINVAFHQNSIPVISEICLINDSARNFADITVSVRASPAFLSPTILRFAEARANATQRLGPVPVELDPRFLFGLTEAVQGEVELIAATPAEEIARLVAPCTALSPTEWTGLATTPELLAAFVRPNDPSVDVLLRKAAEKLANAGRDPSFDGYRSNKKARAWEVASAIWAALCDEEIVYAVPPRSFEQDGQKVRTPTAIIERKIATCLDLVLLFASILEQAGLNPLVGLCKGHAFAGLWLIDEEFTTAAVDEPQPIRKRMQLEELVLVETTFLTNRPPPNFRAAIEQASPLVADDAERPFEAIIDVRRARRRRIKPLNIAADQASSPTFHATRPRQPVELDPPPAFREEAAPATSGAEITVDRLERWKRSLLDLSLRNRLLNFKPTRGAVHLVCSDLPALAELIAGEAAIKLLPAAEVMTEKDPRSLELHIAATGRDARTDYVNEALARGEVHTELDSTELDARLTELFRASRTSLEEGGANNLYVSVGFVAWTPRQKTQRCNAPLLLVPVALERKSVRSGFRLVHYDDDPQINPTLLEMMRQDFDITIPEFQREPSAAVGEADVESILRTVRETLKEVKGFEVTEEVFLSTFSFTKYLMWKDLVDRTALLKRNPVVRHLIDTPHESYGEGSALVDERRLDDEVAPAELALPLPADSSQTAAVVAASRGQDFVLSGPPGTGKSQTIANMIAQLLWLGKRVLFVSAKATALTVVRRRLDEIGLGAFCLEVHSAKAQKRAVLDQLRGAWDEQGEAAEAEWTTATTEIRSVRDHLNAVVRALHQRRKNGLTIRGAMGQLIAGRDLLPGFSIPFEAPEQHDERELAHLRELCETIRIAFEAVGSPSASAFAAVRHVSWSPSWQKQLVALAQTLHQACKNLATVAAELGTYLHVPVGGDPRRVRIIANLAALALRTEARDGLPLLEPDARRLIDAFPSWKQLKERYDETKRRLSGGYREGVFGLDLAALQREWRSACQANVLTRRNRKKRVRARLAPYADAAVPADLEVELIALLELKSVRDAAIEPDEELRRFGPRWRGFATNIVDIEELFRWSLEALEAAALLATPQHPRSFWISTLTTAISHRIGDRIPGASELDALVTRCTAACDAFEQARGAVLACAEATDEWLGRPPGDNWLAEASRMLEDWPACAPSLIHWCKWQEVAAAAEKAGLAPLVSLLTSGSLAPTDLNDAFEIGYLRCWVDRIVEREEPLRTFIAEHHAHDIVRFAALDDKLSELAKRIIKYRLSTKVPPRAHFGKDPEFGLLAREIEKKARHLPLRRLFGQMPHALAALAPCMMMSPLSVAQYLPADASPFDVVIFDEASQLPVWDAIGAIARGQQTIIVGDQKQLPPTAFFERAAGDYGDDSDLKDLDSILDECLGANLPNKHLAWHYRSHYEGLIAFSNARYYDGRLVTFPSPLTNERACHYVHVANGVYERGSARVNREEARAVVRDVLRRLSNSSFASDNSSLGVVTMNVEQQHLIETILDQERRADPDLDRFFTAEWHEPVFVKNLESVQGDERDIILLSVTYGPDETGRISHNFGPLNKDSGTRRLNVAITRARSELAVFATLRPEQIDLSRTKSGGARDLKLFLEYAERGPRALAEAAAPTGRGTESPFEDAVKDALEARGWIVHPQVGAAGFRVDLGIVHPEAPGRYLAGIECDGATYHRSATARDRDILRERVLVHLGWRIHRIWSSDWWTDADRAITNLTRELEEDLASAEQPDPSATLRLADRDVSEEAVAREQDRQATPTSAAPEPPESTSTKDVVGQNAILADSIASRAPAVPPRNSAGPTYSITDLPEAGFAPDSTAFYGDEYQSTLARMVACVIATEGPIFADVLVHRIATAHGFARAGEHIRKTILRATAKRFPSREEEGRTVFWPMGASPDDPTPFRTSTPDCRRPSDIPLTELATLAEQFLGQKEDEIPASMAKELGLERLRRASLERFRRAIRLAKNGTAAFPSKSTDQSR